MGRPTSEMKLIQMGVERLKRLGFSEVTEHNIVIDVVYKNYFEQMLLEIVINENKWKDGAVSLLVRLKEKK